MGSGLWQNTTSTYSSCSLTPGRVELEEEVEVVVEEEEIEEGEEEEVEVTREGQGAQKTLETTRDIQTPALVT